MTAIKTNEELREVLNESGVTIIVHPPCAKPARSLYPNIIRTLLDAADERDRLSAMLGGLVVDLLQQRFDSAEAIAKHIKIGFAPEGHPIALAPTGGNDERP